MKMNITIRADAPPEMGSGHVMRCLTLADELSRRGAKITFITRGSTGPLLQMIKAKGHHLQVLADDAAVKRSTRGAGTAHAHLLPVAWETDAEQTIQALRSGGAADWLIVDHYALDARWERRMRAHAAKILVIDDLADRPHDCDLLLDQNLGRNEDDYRRLVSKQTRLLLGPEHALLRPAFRAERSRALARRAAGGPIRRILVSFGGSDLYGLTATALEAIEMSGLDVAVDVVPGRSDPETLGLTEIVKRMPQEVMFHGFDADMAGLMCDADLAIGASGSSSWERCCLGLPTVMVAVADNQRQISRSLAAIGAALPVKHGPAQHIKDIAAGIQNLADEEPARRDMAKTAASVCDGRGGVLLADVLATTVGISA